MNRENARVSVSLNTTNKVLNLSGLLIMISMAFFSRWNLQSENKYLFPLLVLVLVYCTVNYIFTSNAWRSAWIFCCACLFCIKKAFPFASISVEYYICVLIVLRIFFGVLKYRTAPGGLRETSSLHYLVPAYLRNSLSNELELFSAFWRLFSGKNVEHNRPPNYTFLKRSRWPDFALIIVIGAIFDLPITHALIEILFRGKVEFFMHALSLAAHAYLIIYILGDYRLLKEGGLYLEEKCIELMMGMRGGGAIEYSDIVSVEIYNGPRENGKDTLNLTPIDRPNVLIVASNNVELRGLFNKQRYVNRIFLFVDDPVRFASDAKTSPVPRLRGISTATQYVEERLNKSLSV